MTLELRPVQSHLDLEAIVRIRAVSEPVAMRTLNDRLGYAPLPALIVLRGPEQLAGSPS